jgi:hypothetical protein
VVVRVVIIRVLVTGVFIEELVVLVVVLVVEPIVHANSLFVVVVIPGSGIVCVTDE